MSGRFGLQYEMLEDFALRFDLSSEYLDLFDLYDSLREVDLLMPLGSNFSSEYFDLFDLYDSLREVDFLVLDVPELVTWSLIGL